MGVKPLVSIISPCYNGESYISRMLDSILRQSHSSIELICVDDGSTDRTGYIIQSYIEQFEKMGMILRYFFQENLGQASAINHGLKHVNGDYLCWIDCDDYLLPSSVEIKLNTLEKNPEIGVCTSDLYIVGEADLNKVLKRNSEIHGHLCFQRNQFYLTLAGLSSLEPPGHMLRMSYFDKINPHREISCCREGQNFQILLPMYYHFPRIYIDQPLGYYVIRKNSHFHSYRSPERELQRQENLRQMLEETLNGLKLPETEIQRLLRLSCFSSEIRRLRANVD